MKEATIYIKRLKDNAQIPTAGTEYAAGYDLYAATDEIIDIAPHSTVKIDTGLAMELQTGTFAGIFARSGLATKKGLRPANCVGVVDSDYRGPVIVALHNDTDEMMSVNPGERIAQMIIMDYRPIEFRITDNLSDTNRGAGGFGSTGA